MVAPEINGHEDQPQVGQRLGWVRDWLKSRSPAYVGHRVASLGRRFGATPERTEERTRRFVELLADRGYAPTLAVPGRVVARHGPFIRELRDRGVELAVHAFDHLDLRSLPPGARRHQFSAAMEAFDAEGIPFVGFRCPYLGYEATMRDLVPDRFRYGSNVAVRWNAVIGSAGGSTYDALQRFYDPVDVSDAPVLPFDDRGLLELPVSLPDDLQLLDGLRYPVGRIAEIWCDTFDASREQRDLFVALVHPETADRLRGAFEILLDRVAAQARPTWVATLAEITEWWRAREAVDVEVQGDTAVIHAPAGATILGRGIDAVGPPWDERHRVIETRRVPVDPDALPFVGLPSPNDPLEAALRREGYVVRRGPEAQHCATVLDAGRSTDPEKLVRELTTRDGPQLRVWRWPEGALSCMSITGDLDALSLPDIAARLTLLRRGPGTDDTSSLSDRTGALP